MAVDVLDARLTNRRPSRCAASGGKDAGKNAAPGRWRRVGSAVATPSTSATENSCGPAWLNRRWSVAVKRATRAGTVSKSDPARMFPWKRLLRRRRTDRVPRARFGARCSRRERRRSGQGSNRRRGRIDTKDRERGAVEPIVRRAQRSGRTVGNGAADLLDDVFAEDRCRPSAAPVRRWRRPFRRRRPCAAHERAAGFGSQRARKQNSPVGKQA